MKRNNGVSTALHSSSRALTSYSALMRYDIFWQNQGLALFWELSLVELDGYFVLITLFKVERIVVTVTVIVYMTNAYKNVLT